MTIQELVADYRTRFYGTEWQEQLIRRLLYLQPQPVCSLTQQENEEYRLLRLWLSDVVAAGVEKFETNLYGSLPVTRQDLIRISTILDDEGCAASVNEDYLELAQKMRLLAVALFGKFCIGGRKDDK